MFHPKVINNTNILDFYKEGAHFNTIEQFYINADYASNSHLNDSHTVFPNAISDTLLKTHCS